MMTLSRSRTAAWLALAGAVLMAVGSGVLTDDLRLLFGARADGLIAAARVLAALVAAVTGSIVAGRPEVPPDA